MARCSARPLSTVLRKSLNDLDEYSFSKRKYVPDGLLAKILSEQKIYDLLSALEPAANPEDLKQMVNRVHSKAQKVLATLIRMESTDLIRSFLDRELYDERLPFHQQDLNMEVLGESWIKRFLHEQHTFLAPVFYKGESYDSLDSKYILPFQENIRLSEGAFGVVYKIKIHANHQRLSLSANGNEAGWFARKEFKIAPNRNCKTTFEKEKKILQQLLKLNHPNIIPLLATYSHDNHFNMIFPLAKMTLHDYLRCDLSLATKSLFEKFCGLTEALYYLHNFTIVENGEQTRLFGYHHDLKPCNILFLDERFMIADFGHANFKDIDQPSQTLGELGTMAYRPPEARDGAGRAYDIWSFGCILAEVVTFAAKGAKGVVDFAQDRCTQVTLGKYSDDFHDGKKVKKEVLEHFRQLESLAIDRSEPIIARVLQLVKEMLEPDERQRPMSKDVLKRLRVILDTTGYPSPATLDTSSLQTQNPTPPVPPSLPPTPASFDLPSCAASSKPSSSLSLTSSIPTPTINHLNAEGATLQSRKRTENVDAGGSRSTTPPSEIESVPADRDWVLAALFLLVVLYFSVLCVSVWITRPNDIASTSQSNRGSPLDHVEPYLLDQNNGNFPNHAIEP